MIVAAWGSGNTVYAQWGPTDPFHYDKFLIRFDGEQQEADGGNAGAYSLSMGNGAHRVVVEGCDVHTFQSSTCRQGWTAFVDVSLPQPVSEAPPAAQPPHIDVAANGDGSFTVTGRNFHRNVPVLVRMVDLKTGGRPEITVNSNENGAFRARTGRICTDKEEIDFSATDHTHSLHDLTGEIFSNTAPGHC